MDKKKIFKNNNKDHREKVYKYVMIICKQLINRALVHDLSKDDKFECNIFSKYISELSKITYGDKKYFEIMEKLKPALEHHYKNNRHHPEHFKNGINDMNIVDIIEMFCDWKASTERHIDGDIEKSIEINSKRFCINEQIIKILKNSIVLLEGKNDIS